MAFEPNAEALALVRVDSSEIDPEDELSSRSEEGIRASSKVDCPSIFERQIPPPAPNYFVRSALRARLKEQLHSTIQQRGPTSDILFVHGMAGVGKSQLVRAYANEHREDYTSMCWINADTQTTWPTVSHQILNSLSGSDVRDTETDMNTISSMISQWANERGGRWLLVLDNADDLTVDVRNLFAGVTRADILITSRSNPGDFAISPTMHSIEVNPFDLSEGTMFLENRIDAPELLRSDLEEVVELLGGVPLAIELFASYIANTPTYDTKKYLLDLKQRHEALTAGESGVEAELYSASISQTFEISYDYLHDNAKEAISLLSLMSFLDHNNIFLELFGTKDQTAVNDQLAMLVASASDVSLQDALSNGFETLKSYAFLSQSHENDTYSIHSLVRNLAFERLEVEQRTRYGKATWQFLGFLAASFEHDPTLSGQLVPHVMACFHRVCELERAGQLAMVDVLEPLMLLTRFLEQNAQYNSAYQLRVFAHRYHEQFRHRNPLSYLQNLRAIGGMLGSKGRFHEALQMLRTARDGFEELYGSSHPLTLDSASGIATALCGVKEDCREAEALLRQILIKYEELDIGHHGELYAMNKLAELLSAQGKQKEARDLHQRALRGHEKALGLSQSESLTIRRALGRRGMSTTGSKTPTFGESTGETATWQKVPAQSTLTSIEDTDNGSEVDEKMSSADYIPEIIEDLPSQSVLSGPSATSRDSGFMSASSSSRQKIFSRSHDASAEHNVHRIAKLGMPIESPLDTALEAEDLQAVTDVLKNESAALATGPMSWLTELLDLGYSFREIAEVLLERQQQSPWIYFEPWIKTDKIPNHRYHKDNCVHARRGENKVVTQAKTVTSQNSVEATRILIRDVVSLCGLAGVVPDASSQNLRNGNVQFQNSRAAAVSFGDSQSNHTMILNRIRNVLRALCTAIAHLQDHQGCCDYFTILFRCPSNTTLELQRLDHRATVQFFRSVEMATLHDTASMQDSLRSARMILAKMPSSEKLLTGVESKATTTGDRLHICAMTAQLMCLGLVSYCQAHLDIIEPFFLEHGITEITLMGTLTTPDHGTCIMASPHRLTCLESMLHRPVLAFSVGEAVYSADNRHDVLANAEDLIDTWGPGAVTYKPSAGESDAIMSLLLRDGLIVPVSQSHYHWDGLAQQGQYKHGHEWSSSLDVRIGVTLEVNSLCNRSELQCLARCEAYTDPIDTRPSVWKLGQREAGMQGGQYVIATYNQVYTKDAGESLKQIYLNRLQDHHMADLHFFEATCGLQVSFCSGLARRLRVRQMLAELLPIFATRRVPSHPDWPMLCNKDYIIDVLQSGDLEDTLQRMAADSLQRFNSFIGLVEQVMVSLKNTGTKENGKSFAVALIPHQSSEPIRRVDFSADGANFWTHAMRDTDICATFAYFTYACLEIEGQGCRASEKTWHRELLMLQTEVHRQFGKHRLTAPPDELALRNGETFQIGRSDADTSILLQATVIRPSASHDPRLLVQPLTVPNVIWKRFMVKRHQYLREKLSPSDNTLRAFITSTKNTGFSFS